MSERGRIFQLALLAVVVFATLGVRGEEAVRVEERMPSNVDQRLNKVERLLESQGLLDMLSQLESLQKEMQRLRGEIEVQTHTLEQIKQRQRDLYVDLDKRLQRTEALGVAGTTPSPPGPSTGSRRAASPPVEVIPPTERAASQTPPAGQPGAAPLTVEVAKRPPAEAPKPRATAPAQTEPAAAVGGDPAAARAAYQRAFTLLKQGRYEQAVTAFNEFLATYPNSSYADNAQYWLAESYYVLRRFEQAIVEYQKLVANYPDSQKLTHSMLKIGYSYYELGQMDQARTALEDLKTRYPGTTAARLAEERLQRMKLVQQ